MSSSACLLVAGSCLAAAAACNVSPFGGGSGGNYGNGGNYVTVTIQDFTFAPSSLSVRSGTAVVWTNNGPSTHTATSDNGAWDSGTLGPTSGGAGGAYGGGAGAYQVVFVTPGTYRYHCVIHPPSKFPGFTGVIIVTP